MASDQITVVSMTDLNNSNAEDKRPSEESSDDGASRPSKNEQEPSLEEEWSAFESSHAQDLDDVAHSRSARHFEKHAERKELEVLLSVHDLEQGSFTDDLPKSGTGPRDYTKSSWLDTDSVMDRFGDDFTPPDPHIGHMGATTLTFWGLLGIGIIGIIVTVLLPSLAGLLGTIFGACIIIGGTGLIIQHRDHKRGPDSSSTDFPDGARL